MEIKDFLEEKLKVNDIIKKSNNTIWMGQNIASF